MEKPVILVIDALDECLREDDMKLLRHLSSPFKTELPGKIMVFLTSRPEGAASFCVQKDK